MRLKVLLTWKRIAGLGVLLALGGLAVSWSGFVSIAASSGHWSVTRWFLGWTMENAVETQSIPVSKPKDLDLGDPALVQRSAGHFATGCAPCHGAPGVPQSPVVEAMTPSPPRLEDKVGEWSDEELFWIVKHGLKYTGMPAWPTQRREDEVWAQVAFLRALPEMTREEYADLALGGGLADDDIEAGGETTPALDGIVENALTDCARCHGRDGLGVGDGPTEDAFPIIAGQPEVYLYATLRAFALGWRESGFMEPPATRYEPEVLLALARHYARQPPGAEDPLTGAGPQPERLAPIGTEPMAIERIEPIGAPEDVVQDAPGVLEGGAELLSFVVPAAAAGPPQLREDLLELGRRLALDGIPAQKVPACQSCHSGLGRERNAFFPYLTGQPEWYLSEQLQLWKEDKRGGTQYEHIMQEIAEEMTPEQIEAVAAWYAAQPPGGARFGR